MGVCTSVLCWGSDVDNLADQRQHAVALAADTAVLTSFMQAGTVTDEDIDAIIEKGERDTEQLNQKLQVHISTHSCRVMLHRLLMVPLMTRQRGGKQNKFQTRH